MQNQQFILSGQHLSAIHRVTAKVSGQLIPLPILQQSNEQISVQLDASFFSYGPVEITMLFNYHQQQSMQTSVRKLSFIVSKHP